MTFIRKLSDHDAPLVRETAERSTRDAQTIRKKWISMFFKGAVFICLLLFSMDAYSLSREEKLKMFGYSESEIEDILSGKRSRKQIDMEFKLSMLGYGDSEIEHLMSMWKVQQKPGVPPPRKQEQLNPKKKGRLISPAIPYFSMIRNAALKHGVDFDLVLAVIKVESNLKPRAISPKGAAGLMQLMPQTAKKLGVSDRFDPKQNIEGGVRYLSNCMKIFNNVELALAAYNVGPPLVLKMKKMPSIKETRDYVKNVLKYRRLFHRLIGQL